jgi:hypothetical protein
MAELIKCDAVQAALDACASDGFSDRMSEVMAEHMNAMIAANGADHIAEVNEKDGRIEAVTLNYRPRY